MSFYDESARDGGFSIDLGHTTELLERFHRTLMDRREPVAWEAFDRSKYTDDLVAHARREWSARAVAEYQSTAQFGQLLHRLTLVGAPVELIGAATRLATDECRHAELCARFADLLGGRQHRVSSALSLYAQDELPLAIYRTILSVCCFGETLSVPMLRAIYVVATDPVAERVAEIIAADEEYHARFGWQALEYLTPDLPDVHREKVQQDLSTLLGHFERVCAGSPDTCKRLAGREIDIEPGDEPNLGTLTREQYAAIFYATIDETILPNLEALGFDARGAWEKRIVPA